jgi:hypothetical protein
MFFLSRHTLREGPTELDESTPSHVPLCRQQQQQKFNSAGSLYWAIGLPLGPAGPARSMVGRSQEKEKCSTMWAPSAPERPACE